jgi:preprotein translocase SecE subunit
MARDRQRAKQRRRRQSGAPARGPRSQRARDIGLDDAEVEESGLGGNTPAPNPLEHASADVDEALLAETGADATEDRSLPDIVEEEHEVERVEHEAEVRHRRGLGRFIGFLAASWAELQRVQWPDRRHVGQGTAVVLGFVVIAGLYLGLLDAVINPLIQKIL